MTADEYAATIRFWSERIIGAVHDDGPDELLAHIGAALAETPPPGTDPVVALVTVLAAQVDPDATPDKRLGWIEGFSTARHRGRVLRECGTRAAYVRHRRRGEVPCPACTTAHSVEDAAYAGRRRAAA